MIEENQNNLFSVKYSRSEREIMMPKRKLKDELELSRAVVKAVGELNKDKTEYPDFVENGLMPKGLYKNLVKEQNLRNISFLEEGGTRFVFEAVFDKQTNVIDESLEPNRIVKIDKPRNELSNNNGRTHHRRGYTSERELDLVIKIRNLEKNHLSQIMNYKDLKEFGKDGVAIIENKVDGYDLESIVNPKSKLNEEFRKENPKRGEKRFNYSLNDWIKVFKDVSEALNYLHSQGILHRDLNRGNIIVHSNNGNVEGTVIDLGNAGTKKNILKRYIERAVLKEGSLGRASEVLGMKTSRRCKELRKKSEELNINLENLLEESKTYFEEDDKIVEVSRCTAGGHYIVNPKIIPEFNEKYPEMYDERDDIYAMGVNMFYSLTGKRVIEIEDKPEKGNVYAVDYIDRKNSLLDSRNKFQYEKYEELLNKRISEIKLDGENEEKLEMYKQIIKKCLTHKEDKYQSIEEVLEDFERLENPDKPFTKKEIKKKKKFFTLKNAIKLQLITLGTAGVIFSGVLAKNYMDLQESKRRDNIEFYQHESKRKELERNGLNGAYAYLFGYKHYDYEDTEFIKKVFREEFDDNPGNVGLEDVLKKSKSYILNNKAITTYFLSQKYSSEQIYKHICEEHERFDNKHDFTEDYLNDFIDKQVDDKKISREDARIFYPLAEAYFTFKLKENKYSEKEIKDTVYDLYDKFKEASENTDYIEIIYLRTMFDKDHVERTLNDFCKEQGIKTYEKTEYGSRSYNSNKILDNIIEKQSHGQEIVDGNSSGPINRYELLKGQILNKGNQHENREILERAEILLLMSDRDGRLSKDYKKLFIEK
ncbi:protein kinase [Candidatus Woesearchaeota archaeon]|nr:protein kinase [Candidatus Woesearchaeota archaeon]